jgi:hypothetical protein
MLLGILRIVRPKGNGVITHHRVKRLFERKVKWSSDAKEWVAECECGWREKAFSLREIQQRHNRHVELTRLGRN